MEKQDIQCQLLPEKSVSLIIEGILECVTVAIQVNKPISKTCVISCIYRTPTRSIPNNVKLQHWKQQ